MTDIIGIEDAVILTGYKKSTLYRKTSTNVIPFHKRSNKVVFKRSELEAWMLENRQETIDERVKRLDQQFLSKKQKA
ncbi:AlpA family transcriptional regulator [Dysgonomonas sp. Marseille-P4677]|uniref:helix-turn-helix transcriptional regulator n=1 Tax=Dysgonomonas sp. Marseille-P4677 TaxID=2364790 RepID=UPI001F42736A|nr:helix-turn-helix domain-containing protein [Dysgonomonas sp. Marseille-P4677]